MISKIYSSQKLITFKHGKMCICIQKSINMEGKSAISAAFLEEPRNTAAQNREACAKDKA